MTLYSTLPGERNENPEQTHTVRCTWENVFGSRGGGENRLQGVMPTDETKHKKCGLPAWLPFHSQAQVFVLTSNIGSLANKNDMNQGEREIRP